MNGYRAVTHREDNILRLLLPFGVSVYLTLVISDWKSCLNVGVDYLAGGTR